jgi:hypothetical protein
MPYSLLFKLDQKTALCKIQGYMLYFTFFSCLAFLVRAKKLVSSYDLSLCQVKTVCHDGQRSFDSNSDSVTVESWCSSQLSLAGTTNGRLVLGRTEQRSLTGHSLTQWD